MFSNGRHISIFAVALAIFAVLFVVYTVLTPTIISAQIDCAPLMKTIQQSLEMKCSALSDDQVCVGNMPVIINYVSQRGAETAGQIPLANVDSLVTNAQDLSKQEWGVSLVKAKVANSAQNASAIFMLYGQTFLGKSADASSSNLPQMHSFHFSTGNGVGQMCPGLPTSGLFVQSPLGQSVRFTVDGADLTVQGSIVLKAPPGTLSISVLDGQMSLALAGQTYMTNSGQTISFPLGGNVGLDVSGAPAPSQLIDYSAGPQGINKAGLCNLVKGAGVNSAWCGDTIPDTMPQSVKKVVASSGQQLHIPQLLPSNAAVWGPTSTPTPTNLSISTNVPTYTPTYTLTPTATVENITNVDPPNVPPDNVSLTGPTFTATVDNSSINDPSNIGDGEDTSVECTTYPNCPTLTPTSTRTFTPTITPTPSLTPCAPHNIPGATPRPCSRRP